MTSFKLRRAARLLADGGIVACPTEAVYGLGCDPLQASAVQRILEIKGRRPGKGLILIASDPAQLSPYLLFPDPQRMSRVQATWPGPHTWVFDANPSIPAWITGGRNTVAARVTAHPLAAALCSAFGGALISTSANRSGGVPARSALQARLVFGNEVDLYLHGACGRLERPTPVRDARSGKLLRA
ncbi:MAG: L-threonylcarbamoyladenylate synthase [Pseudomonadota bacterium]